MTRISVGAGSEVAVIETALCKGCERADIDTEIDIILGEGAVLHFHSVRKCAAGGRSQSVVRAALEKDARLDMIDGRLGGGDISSRVSVELRGEGAKTELRTLFFGSGSDNLDLDYRVGHFARATKSRIITKGALADRSRARYRGLITTGRDLTGCSGQENADTLLLSRDARLDCAPELRVGSEDVRCGHGMSVSGLDERRLFYLMSRGLNRVSAMEATAKGFVDPIMSGIADDDLRQVTEELLSSRLRCALATVNSN
ncbi:MAG: SufD family Fe-S cluster assembly protein [Patescibacteria group bacterium]|nr:SufD family Fe-S cluster assembly protein [Patescibacteria group bacterium]